MSVTVSGLSGLTKAYTSVLSADGSLLILGASRWLEAPTGAPARPPAITPRVSATEPTIAKGRFIARDLLSHRRYVRSRRVDHAPTALVLRLRQHRPVPNESPDRVERILEEGLQRVQT